MNTVLSMKRFLLVVLSFFLPVAGVVWALDSCLHLHDHIHDNGSVSAEPHWADDSLQSYSTDRLDSDPHCAYLHFEVDPAIGNAGTQVAPFTRAAALNGSTMVVPVVHGDSKELYLSAVFTRFPSFLALSGLPHHLFFSVFRI